MQRIFSLILIVLLAIPASTAQSACDDSQANDSSTLTVNPPYRAIVKETGRLTAIADQGHVDITFMIKKQSLAEAIQDTEAMCNEINNLITTNGMTEDNIDFYRRTIHQDFERYQNRQDNSIEVTAYFQVTQLILVSFDPAKESDSIVAFVDQLTSIENIPIEQLRTQIYYSNSNSDELIEQALLQAFEKAKIRKRIIEQQLEIKLTPIYYEDVVSNKSSRDSGKQKNYSATVNIEYAIDSHDDDHEKDDD